MNTDQAIRKALIITGAIAIFLSSSLTGQATGLADQRTAFVRISPRDPRYLELSDGTPYIPNGINLIAPPGQDEQAEARMEAWLRKLSDNHGNFIRLWLSNPYFDVEHQQSGQYEEKKARRLDRVLQIAGMRGLRVKMTLEHFRHFFGEKQRWAAKPQHHVSMGGPARDVDDFFKGAASRDQFKRKLGWFRQRYGDNPTVFAWELWNEINAVSGTGWKEWTEEMLAELRRLFPLNLVTQSLGSFDTDRVRESYRWQSILPDNDVAQVHRYLDLGAALKICHGPVDLLAADAVRELLAFGPAKPVILAESGAVEPNHTGPFKLYAADKAGIILHDILFAPFFTGAAGAGQSWHWDQYVALNDLWFHFRRFSEAVKGLDPPAQGFEPVLVPHSRLRILALRGKTAVVAWCRDSRSNWRTELAEGLPPETVHGETIDLKDIAPPRKTWRVRAYDPWRDKWRDLKYDEELSLPDFSRSLVLRIDLSR